MHGIRATVVALILAGCTGISTGTNPAPTTVYEPDLAGPIADWESYGVHGVYTIRVRGETLEIDEDVVALKGHVGNSDRLVIYGEDQGRAWFVAIPDLRNENQPECYDLRSTNAWERPDGILFGFAAEGGYGDDIGILLPKAEEWPATNYRVLEDGRFPIEYGEFCLNMWGEVRRVELVAAG